MNSSQFYDRVVKQTNNIKVLSEDIQKFEDDLNLFEKQLDYICSDKFLEGIAEKYNE